MPKYKDFWLAFGAITEMTLPAIFFMLYLAYVFPFMLKGIADYFKKRK